MQLFAYQVPALSLGELGGCLVRWVKGGVKNTILCSESNERTPKKGNEHESE